MIEKVIEPGTWRYLGQRCLSMAPNEIPIAGSSIQSICSHINGYCYRIGRVNLENAFIVVKDQARLLYVRPEYKGYRVVALKVFPKVPWNADFDHALAKNICRKANPPFRYVLLLRVPPGVNRQHGLFEKLDQLQWPSPEVCFADDRIFDKWLGRPPKSRGRSADLLAGYSYENRTDPGLTLKQRGKLAYAIGVDDYDLSMSGLALIKR